MAWTAEQLSYAGYLAMNHEMRQNPEDLYNTERPLLKALQANKKPFPGAKQYIIEKLRTTNDQNFQWYAGSDAVTFNRRRTITQAQFAWGSAHDGFGLDEDELTQNYIVLTDDTKSSPPTTDEQKQFVDLIEENTRALKEGFAEKFDYELHRDGTQDTNAVAGLDLLIATNPTTGTMGGLNRANVPLWRNYFSLSIASTTGLLSTEMEKAWREVARRGGKKPNLILAGAKFIDAYRAEVKATHDFTVAVAPGGATGLDAGKGKLYFKGVEIQHDPTLDQLETDLNGTPDWDKRCYMLNTETIKLRPAKGHDMITRKPPRAYNRYVHYWGLTWKGAMTTNRPGANAVLSIA